MLVADQRPLISILGEKTAKALSKHLALNTIGELLEHFPRRYGHRGELTPLISLPLGEVVTVLAEIIRCSERRVRGKAGSVLEIVVTDGESQLNLTFFNQSWRSRELIAGKRGLFSGRVSAYRGRLQLAHPDYELFDSEVDSTTADDWAKIPIPIYPATAALPSWRIARAVSEIIAADPVIPELLQNRISELAHIKLSQAIVMIHQPGSDSDWQQARYVLKEHEAVLLQLGILLRRSQYEKQQSSVRLPGRLLKTLDSNLPFSPTKGQLQAGEQIAQDLASGHPMHRLLQGDVGSGKTLVALRAALIAAESGGQVAVLAPTEILAEQHFASMSKLLGEELAKDLDMRLLTSSTDSAAKKKALLNLASGVCRLVVGTHALIQEKVQFFDLALAIIDEQHRFGVAQRDALRSKAKNVPHLLAMTATPIPRSLALTVFGDLELSYLRELPAGRGEVKTHLVPNSDARLVARVWQRVSEEIRSGHQVFVVCPRIDGDAAEPDMNTEELEQDNENGNPKLAAAVEIHRALQSNPNLKSARIGLLHGRLSQPERSSVMDDFSQQRLDILVATTVIEVGVDVPNATTMVILDADRFGLAQLHQLRGRIGRGSMPGLCILLSSSETQSARERLDAMVQTIDGFALSELDLEIRGEGDVLGDMQSGGRSRLKLLRVTRDSELIVSAREIAAKLATTKLSADLLNAIDPQLSAAILRS